MKMKSLLLTVASLALFVIAGWIASPWHPTLTIGSLHRSLDLKLGLDLQGGSHLIFEADTSALPADEASEAIAGVRDVIERRVNAFGVSEPRIQTNRAEEKYRIIVELAGVNDPDEAIAQIGETPQLDFRQEITGDMPAELNVDGQAPEIGPVFERTDLTGKNLKRSTVSFDQVSGTPQVNLVFDKEGAEVFRQLTADNLGRRIAIYLDAVPISAPVVQSEITNGQAVISGGFTVDEAKQLAQRLNAGALPIPIELVSRQSIGPSLGQLSVAQSTRAGIIGLIAVIVWMILYYRIPGVIASVALCIYSIILITLIKLVPVTLTLAGIAGIILSIGMAVDANVLIFERFKENVRLGRSLQYALAHGFKEAWSSITAANVSSLIIAVILYLFGTSIIRGFALTFSLGIIVSMFTAIVLTRTLLALFIQSKIASVKFLLPARTSTSL